MRVKEAYKPRRRVLEKLRRKAMPISIRGMDQEKASAKAVRSGDLPSSTRNFVWSISLLPAA